MTFIDFFSAIKENNSLKLNQVRGQGNIESIDNQTYYHSIFYFITFLKSKKIKSERIISFIESGTTWNIIDFGITLSGNLHIPIPPTLKPKDFKDIVNKLKPKLILVSNLTSNLKEHLKGFSDVTINVSEKKINGEKNDTHEHELSKEANLFFLTSGTSNTSKGIHHKQSFVMDNIIKTKEFYNIPSNSKALSFLPLHYAFERMYNYIFQYSGLNIYYANPNLSLSKNFTMVQPNVACIVPALLEQILDDKENLEAFLVYFKDINPLIICSGASIYDSLEEKIEKYNLKIYEMYGSSETLIVSANNNKNYHNKSSGYIIEPNRVKIDGNNSLWVKTKMIGYEKNLFNPSKALENQWYNTGDIAMINHNFLTLKGRESIVFKNNYGLFIDPNEVENKLKKIKGIKRSIIFLNKKKELSCIFELDKKDNFKSSFSSLNSFISNQTKANKIIYFAFTYNWTVEGGELTISYKEKRKQIINKYESQLKTMKEWMKLQNL